MNVKISNYDNLEQKFHLPVSFQVTSTLQAKPSSISQSSLNKNTPSARTQTPRLSADSLGSESVPEKSQESLGDPAMSEMGVGRTVKGSAKPEKEEKGPSRRTLPRRVWGARPRVSGLSTVHTQLERLRLPTPGPVPARPLRSGTTG